MTARSENVNQVRNGPAGGGESLDTDEQFLHVTPSTLQGMRPYLGAML